jgi:hypothetical protein
MVVRRCTKSKAAVLFVLFTATFFFPVVFSIILVFSLVSIGGGAGFRHNRTQNGGRPCHSCAAILSEQKQQMFPSFQTTKRAKDFVTKNI